MRRLRAPRTNERHFPSIDVKESAVRSFRGGGGSVLADGAGLGRQDAPLDELVGSYARGWTLDRMPAVDRMILRIGVFELRHVEDVPDPVAIDEAIDLARELSTDDSPRFVNGVLAGVSTGRPGSVALPAPDRVEVPAGVELAPVEDTAD